MNEVLRTIGALHSVHGGFTDQPVTGDELAAILTASTQAGSASLRQSYSIIVLDDPRAMRELAFYEAANCLIYCIDFTRMDDAYRRLNLPVLPHYVNLFLAAAVDTGLAAQNAALAASSLGLGSLFSNSIHRTPLSLVYDRLGLPEDSCFPLLALFIGHAPAEASPPPHRGRYLGPGLVHFGRYQRLAGDAADQMIEAYDNPANRLALDDRWAATGAQHYLEWLHRRDSGRGPSPAKNTEIERYLVRASGMTRA